MFAAALLIAALSAPSALSPGVAQPSPPAPPPASTAPATESGNLPVSLSRIRRELRRETTETERFENFRLLTSLNVFGEAPPVEFFTDDETGRPTSPMGAVRYGGMTHSEFLAQVTPREFQPPVMNLSSGLFSLSNWIVEKRREAKRRKEAEAQGSDAR